MKNYLQNQLKEMYKSILLLFVVLLSFNGMNAQCNTKITDLDHNGRDYVCGGTTTQYQAIRDIASVADTLDWSLSGGGTILSVSDDDTVSTVTIQWDDLPDSGPYCLTLTEHNGCTGSDKMYIYIEKDNLNLACNDLVLVALDNNCHDTIGADKILEAPLYPDDSYTTTVFNTDNTPRAEPIVTMNDLGDTLMVVVKHDCSGIACMGRIAFQDNLATMLSCRTDTIKVECDESLEPENPNIGFPLAPGSQVTKLDDYKYKAIIPGDCGGEFTLVYVDDIQELECGEEYEIIIDRTWTAIDASDNNWSCSEVIARSWANFDSVCAPPNYDGLNGRPLFQCNDAFPNNGDIYWPYKDSIPGPNITGYPTHAGCSNIQFLYEDLEIPICGYNRKIVRHWIILDWCTGHQKACDQILTFNDERPPVFHLPPDTIVYYSDEEHCYGTAFPLPEPTVDFECSDWEYEVLGYSFPGDGSCDPHSFLRHENLFGNSQNGFGISQLPVDTPVCVTYKVTDECDNYSYGNVLIIIRDNQQPTAACETHTVVTLGQGTKLYATSLDDDSWDNCGIEKYEIKRTTNKCGDFSDLLFGDFVNLCCNDVGEDVMVILRVTDTHGNTSQCMGLVTVIDNERPVLTHCPADFSVNCTENYSNIFIGGKPTATDNCDDIFLTFHDTPHLNDCGIGYVNRVWTIKDKSDLETTQKCRQRINVIDPDPLTEDDIDWPDDFTVSGCWPDVNIDEYITGLPTINNESCKSLGIAHSDRVITNTNNEDACVVVERTFTVTDWCRPYMDYITHVQNIYILDGGAPEFTNCNDTIVYTGAACTANVTLSANATDDCTDTDHLKYKYKVDKGNDGTFELSGPGNTVSTSFDRGLNKVVFTVEDACGNETTCTRYVRVKDTKPPTPLCLRKLNTSLGTMGMVTLNAKFFDHGSTDNCTPSNMGQCGCYTELRFSFSPDVNDSLITYTCDSLDNGVGQTFDVKVFVTDLDDNQDFCNVRINVIDSKNVCPDAPDPIFAVQGMIMDANEQGLEGFKVKGISLNENEEKGNTETNVNGEYYLNGLGAYDKYEIVPDKNDTPLDGLSTLDLVLIQKHLLGIKNFDNPYKYIASDANNNHSISASDLLELRKLILGIYQQLPSNQSWKFIKADTEFDNPSNPWNYEEKYITDSLMYGLDSIDFIAVKIGDINRSASIYNGNTGIEQRNENTEYLKAYNAIFSNHEEVSLDLKSANDDIITGMQFTLQFDPEILEFVNIENKAINLTNININTLRKSEGLIMISWNNAMGININEDESLFKFNFKSKSSGILKDAVKISSQVTKAEIYNNELETSKLKLRFEGENYSGLQVYQNTPNPFSNTTEIVFDLPQDDNVEIKIIDSTGKLLINTHRHYSKGQNSIKISSDDLDKSGIYFYEITTSKSSVIKRMILIK